MKRHKEALSAFLPSPKTTLSLDKKKKKKRTIDDFSVKELKEMSDEDYMKLVTSGD